MTVNIIDPHLHLFALEHGNYHWLKSGEAPFWPDKSVIQRSFGIDDIINDFTYYSTDNSCNTVDINLIGFVHIEAGFDNEEPWREVEYIESLAFKKLCTVASVNLLDSPSTFMATLQKLKQCSSLIGARHILDDHALTILSNPNTQENFHYLNNVSDFIFELHLPLAKENTNKIMPILAKVITQNNQLSFIVNHAGFPPKDIHSAHGKLWQQNIKTLAQFPNVFIKCSGMEMVDRQYPMAWFDDVARFCLSSFSQERVMLASNFPLCLFNKKNYAAYWQDILQSNFIKQLDKYEKSALLCNNALKIYSKLKGVI